MQVEVTPASELQKASADALWSDEGWSDVGIGSESDTWVLCADGVVVGALHFEATEGDPVMEDVVIAAAFRGRGLGARLVEEAVGSRRTFLSCRGERLGFYLRVGFREVALEEVPRPVRKHMISTGDFPPQADYHYMVRSPAP